MKLMSKIKLVAISLSIFFVFAFGASADTLSQSRRFFISPQYDAQSRAAVNATLRHISDRAYFYVADDYWDDASAAVRGQAIDQIKLLAQEFDSRIYPVETQFFGSESNPGIDGDPRITILLAPLIQNAGGYFDTTNQYLSAETRNSNQREMIYLNIKEIVNLNKMFAFLAHEFQHLISFNQKENLRKVSDDIWLNELRSEYAVTLLGYNNVFNGSHLERRAVALRDNPVDSLTEWKNFPADYGQIGMFGEYIAEHLSPQVIADTLKNNLVGIASVNESLTRNGFSDVFADIYRDWLIANFINDLLNSGRFGYSNKGLNDFRVDSTRTIQNLGDNAASSIADTIKDWQGRWYDISQFASGQNNVLKITFDSSSLASFNVSYIVFSVDGKYETYSFNPVPSSNTLFIYDIGIEVSRIVIMPIKKDKLSGFSFNEIPAQLTLSFERVTSSPENTVLALPLTNPSEAIKNPILETSNYKLETNLPAGSLIRAENDFKVHVINGNWRRHIISPEIFKFYPHLGFNKVKVVSLSVLNQYQESNLIRYAAEQKVYAVNENGARQWLDISGEQFSASGRNWDAIFTINSRELNFYPLGQPISK